MSLCSKIKQVKLCHAYFGVGIFDFIGLYIFEYTSDLSFGENALLNRDGDVERLAAKFENKVFYHLPFILKK